MSRKRAISASEAFLQAIRSEPDDDTHRLVYADWLEENGEPDRAEFIRVQCQLALVGEPDSRRSALEAREAELQEVHRMDWTDLAFVSWLGHSRGTCRNPRKHGFCTTLAEGLRAHLVVNAFLPGDCKQAKGRLKIMEQRMQSRYKYNAATCRFGLWEPGNATFCRGFVEEAQVYPYVVQCFPGALVDLTVLRRLVIDNGGDDEYPMPGLLEVLARLPLESLECRPMVMEEELEALLQVPNFARLADLSLSVSGSDSGDAAIERIASTPSAAGLRSLKVEHEGFTDRAFEAVLDSPHLHHLKRFQLTAFGYPLEISEPLKRECRARFGTEW